MRPACVKRAERLSDHCSLVRRAPSGEPEKTLFTAKTELLYLLTVGKSKRRTRRVARAERENTVAALGGL